MSSPPGDFRSRRMSESEQLEERSATPRAAFDARPQSVLRRDNSLGHSRSFSIAEANRPNLTSRALARGLTASPHIEEKGPNRDFTAPVAGIGAGARSADSASTASTTAASSVWDELDDLKSRIRRLEVTGRMPPASAGNASNSSGDRPRTATTTVTTVSSSPRNNANGISPSTSAFAPTTTSHPLLHSALAKAKGALTGDVYKHLELAAKDALDMANAVGAPGSGVPNVAGVDRNVRRKADSVCRSLTELCLALSESRPSHALPPPTPLPFIRSQFLESRPISRGSVLGVRTRDAYDGGRETAMGGELRLQSRAGMDRFADRKHSLANLNVLSSPRGGSDPAAVLPSPTLRHRGSMLLKEGFMEDRFRAPSRVGGIPNGRRSSFAPTIQSSPLAPSGSSSKRSSLYSESGLRTSQEFTMTGGPINERLASALNSQDPAELTSTRRTLTTRTSARRLAARTGTDVRSATSAGTERLLRR
jgi:hypothetical protein